MATKKKTITSSADVVINAEDEQVQRWVDCQERLPDCDTDIYYPLWNCDHDAVKLGKLVAFLDAGREREVYLWVDETNEVLINITYWLEIGPPTDEDNV